MSKNPERLIRVAGTVGLGLIGLELAQWYSEHPARFLAYLLVAALASDLKIKLPLITRTMSVNFLFVLIGVVELGLPETIAIACTGLFVPYLWRPEAGNRPVQLLFDVFGSVLAAMSAHLVYHGPLERLLDGSVLAPAIEGTFPFPIILAASAYFLMSTVWLASVAAIAELKSIAEVWRDCCVRSYPYYLAGGLLVWAIVLLNVYVQWETSIVLITAGYFVYRAYRLNLSRLESEKKHIEEMAGLHLRTVESLALAIEAKDFTTHDHLRRVRVYALEIGREMGLSEPDLEALRAAALLHDIGKLAVPEHIISKPGRLSPEEFDKMKIHPVIGAEILERVQFPHPVVPIVRAHHESWDGSGYPDGLKGEEIPIGARILAAVDCLDALASDRQYRKALPLEEAMSMVAAEAGKSFDPRVIEVLSRKLRSLEALAQVELMQRSKLSTDVKVTKGGAPAAGFETQPEAYGCATPIPALSSIAAARQEAQMLFELTQDLGTSISLDETLSVVGARLKRLVPYDSIAIYIRRENTLAPAYVNGEDYRLFSSLEIPMGKGLSGWVAENKKPILNGSPSVEASYLNDPNKFSILHSALVVPLEGLSGLVGVLSLYRAEWDGFTKDHLRIVLAITSKMSLAVENALKFRQAEDSATTDYLTNLPNARSLFLRLDSELARCKREGNSLAILVGDLDGFKQFNDRFGHLDGNKVLRYVAEGLQTSCRQYDYVARMGGDEFVLMLPGLKPEALYDKILRLDQIAAEAARKVCGSNWLSMSVGAVTYPDDGDDAEQLLAEADRRMYKAKQEQKLDFQASVEKVDRIKLSKENLEQIDLASLEPGARLVQ